MVRAPAVVAAYEKAKGQLQAEIARRIRIARRKEVVLFVNGYNTSPDLPFGAKPRPGAVIPPSPGLEVTV